MRFYYSFFRYYKRYTRGRLIFDLCLIAVILSLAFYFFNIRSSMIRALTDNVKTEVLKLKSVNKSYVRDDSTVPPLSKNPSYSGVTFPSRIPKSCLFSSTRDCVCYDQHTIVIRDFPLDRCLDIVNGFARF